MNLERFRSVRRHVRHGSEASGVERLAKELNAGQRSPRNAQQAAVHSGFALDADHVWIGVARGLLMHN